MYVDAGKKGIGLCVKDSIEWSLVLPWYESYTREEVPFGTYNEGELRAIEYGLKTCLALNIKEVELYSDSKIARIYFYGLNKKQTKINLLNIQTKIFLLKKHFDYVAVKYIKGKDNPADILTK